VKVLDASVIIAAQRGNQQAREVLAELQQQPESVILPTIALLEVRAGSRVARKWHSQLADLQTAFEVVPLDEEAARLGGRIARQLARQGKKLQSADAALVGCGALRGATVVVTADRDFDQLDKLVIGTTDPVTFTVERVGPK
jgi:predicted nucleic acid-binding protein